MSKIGILGGLAAAVSICGALAGCMSYKHVTSLGNDTYRITREGTVSLVWDAKRLKEEVREDAAEFCASKGKQMKVLELSADQPNATDSAFAKIVFKALDPGDPGLNSNPAAVAAPEKPDPVNVLYADLVKLDELRKKGILTEQEYQIEKKKILDKSK